MDQLHKRFTDEQIKVLFQLYCQGLLTRAGTRAGVQEMLRIGKSQLFVLLKRYRQDPESFSVSYKRATPPRLSVTDEAEIERALLQEQAFCRWWDEYPTFRPWNRRVPHQNGHIWNS